VFEFVDELARHHGIGGEVDQRLARYGRLGPAMVAAVGGDQFPASPMRLVGGGR
jgi:hypothetical protein